MFCRLHSPVMQLSNTRGLLLLKINTKFEFKYGQASGVGPGGHPTGGSIPDGGAKVHARPLSVLMYTSTV